MATSCNPFGGVKTYDDRFYISSEPFASYGKKWWRCDPYCVPQKGDWVAIWVQLVEGISPEYVDSIIDDLESTLEAYDEIHVETIEYEATNNYLKILIAFKSATTKSLHDYGEIVENSIGSSYVDWINYMGADQDWAILEYEYNPSRVSYDPYGYIDVRVKNYGRVSGYISVLVREFKDRIRYIGCFGYTVGVDVELSWRLSLKVNDPDIKYWWADVIKYASTDTCSYYRGLYPESPNVLEIGEVTEGIDIRFKVRDADTGVAISGAKVVIYADGVKVGEDYTDSEGLTGWFTVDEGAWVTGEISKDGYETVELSGFTASSFYDEQTITVYLTKAEAPPSEPKAKFVDKVTEVYVVVEQTGDQFYPESEIKILEGATLLCCGLIKNEGADGECGLYIYDKNSEKYLGGVTKTLKSGDLWLASVELTLDPGEYILEFHAIHKIDTELVVDDTV